MPKKVPAYCHHKASGQAYVKLDGKRVYLGVHGTPSSHRRYAEELEKWQRAVENTFPEVTIGQLTMLYRQWAERHYRKNGKPTSKIHGVKSALKFLNKLFRNLPATELTPKRFVAVRNSMIADGHARTTINGYMGIIRRMVKWAVAEEILQPEKLVALQTVSDLARGRSDAREAEPVKPVPDAFIEAIKGHVKPEVWGMIQFQLATGARPGEVLIVRACDLDMTGDVWTYRPESHKLEHHGKDRVVCIGPAGQGILKPFLTPDLQAYVFGPRKPKAEAGQRPYRRDSYTNAIRRACEEAEVPIWSPNQLRHNFAT
ncbi:MAG: phage integrase SAM-like domain-containing protein, partial [Planctomycetaceae bacterium]|nr:phage integrase SAM-like domain-containing protein [Planctomycetaceae bacterium]